MLDMSKAFYAVDRAILLIDLKTILDPDELHLIKIILNIELKIRCETEESDFFKADANVSKGDGFNSSQITLYLARALCKENNDHICISRDDHIYDHHFNRTLIHIKT